MKVDCSNITDALRSIADSLEIYGVSEIGPWPLYEHIDFLDNVKFSLEMQWHPDHIRFRADRFDEQCKRIAKGSKLSNEVYRAARWKPSMRRSQYSERIARQFLEDGERDNYEAYKALYVRT